MLSSAKSGVRQRFRVASAWMSSRDEWGLRQSRERPRLDRAEHCQGSPKIPQSTTTMTLLEAMVRFLDTQIISYAFKGTSAVSVVDEHISSVVANEFLESHSKTASSATYYIPTQLRHLERTGHFGPSMPIGRGEFRKRGFSKRSTDRLTLYFGEDYPSIVEYGSVAVSLAINSRAINAFRLVIASLDRRKQRRIIRRFEFLCDHRVTCVALQPAVARLGQTLLYRFLQEYKLKKNFRNSVNDMLILAATIHNAGELLTRDSLLVRFCADAGLLKKHGHDEWIRCESMRPVAERQSTSRESKGYINRSWSVRLRRGPSASW